MFLIGCMLYLSIITLIFYRLTFLHLTTAEFTPPYWINMGAVAITTLAGSTLILNGGDQALIRGLMPFLKGFTLFFWAAATRQEERRVGKGCVSTGIASWSRRK